jgi:hypothetical protein
MTNRKLLFAAIAAVIFCSCNNEKKHTDTPARPLQGTWELLSETKIEKGDTTFKSADPKQRMVKIINETHFAFLRHDRNQGKDSTTATFVAGGGKYTLQDKQYTEHLEYCNFREWENNTFTFEVEIQNDTLVQRGVEKIEGLGVDRVIIERYVRVTE